MENRTGIVELSFPFAAGVAAAAIAAQPFALALTFSAAIPILISACSLSRRRCEGILVLLFFALGAMCWCTSALAPPPRAVPLPAIDALAARIDAAGFPGDHSAPILKALLTGRRDSLPPGTVEVFRRSGASHILALSGLHLGVIYLFLRRLLSPMGNSRAARTVKASLTILLCGYYTLATGASPSIVRAFLFILVNECGRSLSGRRHSPAGTFCIALTVQLALWPQVITSTGFQLSYLAMLGITVLFPRLEKWYPDSGRPDPLRYIWKCAALSLSCQLFTAPVAWLRFRSLPLYFLITNLIALPLTEAVIILAIVVLLLQAAEICPQILVNVCGQLVSLLEFCLEAIASL